MHPCFHHVISWFTDIFTNRKSSLLAAMTMMKVFLLLLVFLLLPVFGRKLRKLCAFAVAISRSFPFIRVSEYHFIGCLTKAVSTSQAKKSKDKNVHHNNQEIRKRT